MKKSLRALFAGLFFLAVFTGHTFGRETEINTKFLDSRIKQVKTHNGRPLTSWQTTDKKLSEQNIVSSTEEIAIVTRAYLNHYNLFKKAESLEKARQGLNFLVHMQADNGGFYHYLDNSGRKIMPGNQSASLDEATAQTFLTLSEAAKVFKKAHLDFRVYEPQFLKVVTELEKSLQTPESLYGTYKNYGNLKVPNWLISGRGDLSSIYLLGLSNYYSVTRNQRIENISAKLGQGIIEFSCIEPDDFLFNAHLSFADNPFGWKTSTAYQVAGLAAGSKTFQQKKWLEKAEKETVGFLAHLPASYGPIHGFFPFPDIYPQTPASAYALTLNFSTIAEVAGDEQYEKIAGLCAAWFKYNNPSGRLLFSEYDGSCISEINDNGIVDDRCLTGSAYALLSLMQVYGKRGQEYLTYRPVTNHTFQILKSKTGTPVHADMEIADWPYPHAQLGRVVVMRRMNTFWHKFNIDIEDDYFLKMAFLKQPFYAAAVAVNVRIDGGPILLIPLGGAQGEPYMVKKKITEPQRLASGLHTVGVRYKGLLLTQPAIIDCLVVQPKLEFVRLENDKGKNIVLMKNWHTENKKRNIPREIPYNVVSSFVRTLAGEKLQGIFENQGEKTFLKMPGQSIGIFEW
jgi:hypothetical protein